MGRKKNRHTEADQTIQLLQDILIASLGKAGVPQQAIREIIGVDIVRVNRIVRHLKKARG